MQTLNAKVELSTLKTTVQVEGHLTASQASLLLPSGQAKGSVLSPVVAVPFVEIEPFLCLSLSAALNGADANNFNIWLRYSDQPAEQLAANAADWSPWLPLAPDTHGAEDAQSAASSDALSSRRWSSQLLFLEKTVRSVQYRMELRKTAIYRAPALTALTLHWCSPGATLPAELYELQHRTATHDVMNFANSIKANTAQTQALPRPKFVTRTEWGCPTGQTAGAAQSDLSSTTVTHLIVHHSFSPGNNVTDYPAAVRGIWNFHTSSNGWSDVGYNWLIDQNGVIYEGRAWVGNNEDTRGAHFCGTNGNTMGVCMIGNFSEIAAPQAAASSLVNLLAYKADQRSINPTAQNLHAGSGKTIFNISGHRDGVCSTECPGDLLYLALPEIRQRVAAALKATSVLAVPPAGLRLEQPAPNPAHTTTALRYNVAAPTTVRLRVYNVVGELIHTAFAQPSHTGQHQWNLDVSAFSTGEYLLTLEAGTERQTRMMTIVR